MSITLIEDFFVSEFQKGLKGYFEDNEKAESIVVNNVVSSPSSFSVKEEPCGKQYSVTITVPATAGAEELPGKLLRNRLRIESNLLTAVRKLISHSRKLWNTSVIKKITIDTSAPTSAPTSGSGPASTPAPGSGPTSTSAPTPGSGPGSEPETETETILLLPEDDQQEQQA